MPAKSQATLPRRLVLRQGLRAVLIAGGGDAREWTPARPVGIIVLTSPVAPAPPRLQLFLDQQDAGWSRFTADIHAEIPKEAAAA